MKTSSANSRIIGDITRMLKAGFGDRIRDVLLYGSQARGDDGEGSDYDILVVVNGPVDWRTEDAITDTCYAADLQYDIVTDVKVVSGDMAGSPAARPQYIEEAMAEGVRA